MRKIGDFLKNLMVTLLFFLFVENTDVLYAQDIEDLEDSLHANSWRKENQIRLLNVLAREYSFVDPAKAINNAEKALDLSKELNDLTGVADAYRIMGSVYGQNDSYFQSLEFFLKALDIFEDIKDSVGIANVYISMGHYYQRLQSIEKEISYHSKALEIFRKQGIESRIGVAAHNLSASFLRNGQFDKSRALAEEAIIINSKLKKFSVLSACYNVMGQLELASQNRSGAIEYFEKVLDISDDLGDYSQKVATVSALLNLSEIYLDEERFDLMLIYLNEAITYSKSSLLSKKLTDIYMRLIEYNNGIGQRDSVDFYLKKFQQISNKRQKKLAKERFDLISSAVESHYLKQEKKELEESNLLQTTKLQLAYTSIILISIIIIVLLWSLVVNVRKNRQLARQKLTIQDQKQHLEHLNFTKDKFFSIVAHDIKSPLNSMKSFSDLILNKKDTIAREEMIVMSRMMKKSLDNTLKMAENLLNWARIQMKDVELNRKKIDVAEHIGPVLSIYQDIALKKEIDFRSNLEIGLAIYADPDQLAFIVRNLISNAVKFTKKNGKISVDTFLSDDCNQVKIRIQDNGVGMPEAIKQNVFNLESKYSMKGTEGESGTGLGLMLCHEFLNMNGGEIEIESEENKGTTVILIFEKV